MSNIAMSSRTCDSLRTMPHCIMQLNLSDTLRNSPEHVHVLPGYNVP